MIASDRLIALSGLSGVSAAAHLRACAGASGSTASDLMTSRSGLGAVSAATHLLEDTGVVPSASGAWLIIARRRHRR